MTKTSTTTKNSVFTFRYRTEGYLFLDNLTTLLESGMDMLSAISSLKDEASTKQMKDTLQMMMNEIESGSPFWKAISLTGIYPQRIISLIKIGEESGRLPENLALINNQQHKEREFKAKIHTALVYPSIVVSLILVVGSGVALFILPQLAGVFLSLRIPLPLTTQLLVTFGTFLQLYGLFVVPLFLLSLAIIIYLLFFFSKTKSIGEKILMRTPGVKTVIQQIEISRFGYLLGSILDTGIPVVTGIRSLREATTFVVYKKFYEQLAMSVEEGNSFKKSFAAIKSTNGLLPHSIQQMIVAAEQSGRMPETLQKIGEIYERKADTSSKNITVAIEPILLIIIGIGVFAVAISVILPIYGLIGNLSSLSGN